VSAGLRAALLLALGLLQVAADALSLKTVKAVASATQASPAPRVFSAVRGLETYSTRFFIEWEAEGRTESAEVTPARYSGIAGPYNRRNVYGAALAYGPVMMGDAHAEPMLRAVMRHALCGDAPVLREMGIALPATASGRRVRYEPVAGTGGDWPRVIEARCP
jgi:hypothetical protein